jgi:hypothetical protein
MGHAVTDDKVSCMMEEVDEDMHHAFMVFYADDHSLIMLIKLACVLRSLEGVCHRHPDLTPSTTPLGTEPCNCVMPVISSVLASNMVLGMFG